MYVYILYLLLPFIVRSTFVLSLLFEENFGLTPANKEV